MNLIKKLLIFIVLILISSVTTKSQDIHEISILCTVRLQVGSDLIVPRDAYAQIKSVDYFQQIDSTGNFEITFQKPGDYLLSVQGFGYEKLDTLISIDKETKGLELILIPYDCGANRQTAFADIENNNKRLLIAGGIAPVIYINQHKFERRYKVDYIVYGCEIPTLECMIKYNTEIFKYLDSKYGNKWRVEVRNDVEGLKEYINDTPTNGINNKVVNGLRVF